MAVTERRIEELQARVDNSGGVPEQWAVRELRTLQAVRRRRASGTAAQPEAGAVAGAGVGAAASAPADEVVEAAENDGAEQSNVDPQVWRDLEAVGARALLTLHGGDSDA